jgi:trigger factor
MRLFVVLATLPKTSLSTIYCIASRYLPLNVQFETLENHIAQLTVAIEMEQLEKAKKQAARKLARRVNIPGFRKGKAPYRVLVGYIGEAPIIEEAVEELGQNVYKQALEESKVEPYSMGELADFKLEPQPTFVFTVPMQPKVELNDYSDVRVDYALPEVTDEDVEDALHRLQEENAESEEVDTPAEMGFRITADISGSYADEDEHDDEDEEEVADDDAEDADDSDEDEEEDEDDEHHHDHNALIHEHDAKILLDTDREPVPGFVENLVGAKVGDTVVFEVTYPDDAEKYGEQLANRRIEFVLDINAVEKVTLPEINDEFATTVTEEEDEPLNLEALRARIRENITTSVQEQYDSEYTDKVIEQLMERATFAFPEMMVRNQIESMLEQTAQQVGMALEDFLRITQSSVDDLYERDDYRESAEKSVKQMLVMRGLLEAEQITASEADLNAEIDKFLTQFGDNSESYRSLFDTPAMRESMENSVLDRKLKERLVGIGQGLPPAEPEPVAEQPADEDTDEADAEPVAEQPADVDTDEAEQAADSAADSDESGDES